MLLLVSCDNKTDTPDWRSDSTARRDTSYKRYSVLQGHIHYESKGFRRGTEDLYWTNWGRLEARHSNAELLTPKEVQPQKMVTINNGAYVTVADLARRGGYQFREPFLDSLMRLENAPPPEVTSVEVLQRMKYVKQGQDTILGLIADVWGEASTGTRLSLWRGIVLRQRVNVPDGSHRHEVVAVSIDTVNPPDPSKFATPEGIKYSDQRPGPPRR
jgi:hypothetical protein